MSFDLRHTQAPAAQKPADIAPDLEHRVNTRQNLPIVHEHFVRLGIGVNRLFTFAVTWRSFDLRIMEADRHCHID